MDKKINVDKLRQDLTDHYGTGACAGMPAMMMEVIDTSRASDAQVIEKAAREGFNLSKYLED